jgi:para-aminobenzoate synthetase/4-amino-4-deoxychorismate lyase
MVRNELQAATFRLSKATRIRLLLARSGAIAIGVAPMPEAPAGPVQVALMPLQVAPDDFRLRHKTSRRDFYARHPEAFETLYTDPDGFLTEGSFTSLFVERNGKLITPPLSRGLLPGVLRAELIETGRAAEGDLRAEDLASGFLIGNALRGLVTAVTFAQRSKA